jgi:hypothetical protein
MIDTAYIGFGDLRDLRVVYEYLDNDEGEVWCDIEEVYIGDSKLNMLDYLNDQVIEGLTDQCIFIQRASD